MFLDICGGHVWKSLRKNLSPVFSSGKLKEMMRPMGDVAKQMVMFVEEKLRENEVVNVKEVFSGQFTYYY